MVFMVKAPFDSSYDGDEAQSGVGFTPVKSRLQFDFNVLVVGKGHSLCRQANMVV